MSINYPSILPPVTHTHTHHHPLSFHKRNICNNNNKNCYDLSISLGMNYQITDPPHPPPPPPASAMPITRNQTCMRRGLPDTYQTTGKGFSCLPPESGAVLWHIHATFWLQQNTVEPLFKAKWLVGLSQFHKQT